MRSDSFATRKTPDGRLQVSITGYWHDCDGTLGQHPQFWQINDGRGLDPAMPVVLDKYMRLGDMFIVNGYAFVQRPGMKVENVFSFGSHPAWVMQELPPLEMPAHGPYEATKRTGFTMSPIPDSLVDALPGARSWDSLSDAEKDAIRDKEDRERWLSESPSLPKAVEMLSERKPLANLEREGMLCYYCDKPAEGLLDSVLICRRCRE